MTATPSARRATYQTTTTLPMLHSAEAQTEAATMAKASRPRPVDQSIPRRAFTDALTLAVLAWGSIGDARRNKIASRVWDVIRTCSLTYGYAAADLFSLPSVLYYINSAEFESEPQRYAAFKACRRIGRNLSPETWLHPVQTRDGEPIDLTPYSQEELDYFGSLSKSLVWDQYGQRFLVVFLLAASFGLSARDIAVAHGADCRISNGPVRIYTTYGRPRLIPADEYFADRLRYHIKKRKDQYLVASSTPMPTDAIVAAALRPTPLVQAGAKLPTIRRLASTWRYRRLVAGLPVPAITYLSGRSTHSWLNHFGNLPVGLSGDDFTLASRAPDPEAVTGPSWLNLDADIEDTSKANDAARFPQWDDPEDPFEGYDDDLDNDTDDDDDDDDPGDENADNEAQQ